MTRKKQRRLAFAVTLVLASAIVAAVALYTLDRNIMYFRSPSDLVENPVPEGQRFRIGGLVEQGSFHRGSGLQIDFVVTDGANSVPVQYSGVLPDLFREGQGVVAFGARDASGTFVASEVLAKHDENYMPPEVVDALKRAGRWQEGAATPQPGS